MSNHVVSELISDLVKINDTIEVYTGSKIRTISLDKGAFDFLSHKISMRCVVSKDFLSGEDFTLMGVRFTCDEI